MKTGIIPVSCFVLTVLSLAIMWSRPISVFALVISADSSSSETATLSSTPASESLVATDSASPGTPSDIRKLRDRLASVVAELRKKDEQIIAGEIKTVHADNLEVDTIADVVEKIQLDDTITKYYRIRGVTKEEIALKDMKQGSYIIVTGLRTEGSFSANEIFVDETYDSKAGRITEINSTDYTFKLETFDKETITVAIDRTVNQEVINTKTTSLEGSSFSRLKEGDTVHIVYAVKSIKQQMTFVTPTRLLLIPQAYFNK